MKKIALLFLTGCFLVSCAPLEQENTEVTTVSDLPWTLENDPFLERDPGLIQKLSNGKVIYKGGIVFSGNRRRFGGLSALHVSNNGQTLTAISDYSSKSMDEFPKKDRSKWYQFNITYEEGYLKRAKIVDQGHLYNDTGKQLYGEVESMASDDQYFYISFDGKPDIWKYPKNDRFAKAQPIIELKPFPDRKNAGIEAIAFTGDQRILAIYENNKEEDHIEAWLVNMKTHEQVNLEYINHLEDAKGITTLSNGDMVVLEKKFDRSTGMNHVQLQLLRQEELNKPRIRTEELWAASSNALDNFEGITSYRFNGKEYLLLVSDDNGDNNNPQRTLLLHFELNLTD